MPEQSAAPAQPSGQGHVAEKVSTPRQQTTPAASKPVAVGKPVFEYEWEDGKKDSFATEEDLRKAWREGHLRREDYTKKTQQLAQDRKAFDTERQQFNQSMLEFNRTKQAIDEQDRFLKSRPDISNYILQNMRNPNQQAIEATAKSAVSSEIDELRTQLKELAEWKEQQALMEEKSSIYDHLGKQYEDFDAQAIEASLEEFNNAPEGEETRNLAELLYWANKGKQLPRKVEEKISQSLEAKSRKMPPVPSSTVQRETSQEPPKTLAEAKARFKAKHPD